MLAETSLLPHGAFCSFPRSRSVTLWPTDRSVSTTKLNKLRKLLLIMSCQHAPVRVARGKTLVFKDARLYGKFRVHKTTGCASLEAGVKFLEFRQCNLLVRLTVSSINHPRGKGEVPVNCMVEYIGDIG